MGNSATHFKLDSASVRYGSTSALDQVSISIEPGERVAIVGPSGGGKTTLLRLLNGTVQPTAGSVTTFGDRLDSLTAEELREARSQIGFIHQDLALVPNLRVVQNVIGGKLGRRSLVRSVRDFLFPGSADLETIHALLERVGIAEKLYERTDRLSGGQQQRVAIARALFQEPLALLADEPVSSVDPARAHDTMNLLTELSKEKGLTLCTSLHNLELAREFFPRIIALRQGRVLYDGDTAALDDGALDELFDLAVEERV
jgi:phosphonate transport system ATP-binding protein